MNAWDLGSRSHNSKQDSARFSTSRTVVGSTLIASELKRADFGSSWDTSPRSLADRVRGRVI